MVIRSLLFMKEIKFGIECDGSPGEGYELIPWQKSPKITYTITSCQHNQEQLSWKGVTRKGLERTCLIRAIAALSHEAMRGPSPDWKAQEEVEL